MRRCASSVRHDDDVQATQNTRNTQSLFFSAIFVRSACNCLGCAMTAAYDLAVIGGGHNALVAATLIAKAGLKTVVLERRDRVGGCAGTSELAPGFKCPSLAHMAA